MKSTSVLAVVLVASSLATMAVADMLLWGKIYQGGSYTPLPEASVTISGEWQLHPGGGWSPLQVQTASDSMGLYSVRIYPPIKENRLKVCATKAGWRERCLYNFQVHEGENDLSIWLQPE